jgi:hypothetical protein
LQVRVRLAFSSSGPKKKPVKTVGIKGTRLSPVVRIMERFRCLSDGFRISQPTILIRSTNRSRIDPAITATLIGWKEIRDGAIWDLPDVRIKCSDWLDNLTIAMYDQAPNLRVRCPWRPPASVYLDVRQFVGKRFSVGSSLGETFGAAE